MRLYNDKKNRQKKSYYNDRFYVAPQLPKDDPASDEVFAKDASALKDKFDIKEAYIQKDQLVVFVNPEDIKEVMTFLKDELDYNFLCELSANDFIDQRGEFELFYQMLSTSKRKRMRVKCSIKEKEAIESVSSVYKSADWAEREMFDMFGVIVNNHHYMKRILMPDDWSGHPLRKTYPLHGDEAAQWYEVDKIFGKEYRDIIGPEQRDAARIDKDDTKNFAKIRHEVPYGEEPSDTKTDADYQEENGVFLIKELKKEKSEVLKARR